MRVLAAGGNGRRMRPGVLLQQRNVAGVPGGRPVRRDALAAGAAVVADGPLGIEADCAAHTRERRCSSWNSASRSSGSCVIVPFGAVAFPLSSPP